MNPILAYAITLLFYFFNFSVLTWGLNIQFGLTGILDFALITFFAVGAYIAGVFSMGPPSLGSQYIFGLSLPFPIGIIAGAIIAGLLGMLIGLVAFRRLRSDYLAIVMIAVGTIIYDLVSNYVPLFNGVNGTTGVPQPFVERFGLGQEQFLVIYTILSGIVMLIAGFFVHRLFSSPLGRIMRAVRDDPDAVRSIGKNPFRYQMLAMVLGCVYAAVAGGLLIEFISAFDPSGWTTGETFIIFAALIIGGVGNNWGAMLGALLVPVAFQEATRFLPDIGNNPALIPALRNVVVGALLIGFLWFRPQGILPERLKRFKMPDRPLKPAGTSIASPTPVHDVITDNATHPQGAKNVEF